MGFAALDPPYNVSMACRMGRGTKPIAIRQDARAYLNAYGTALQTSRELGARQAARWTCRLAHQRSCSVRKPLIIYRSVLHSWSLRRLDRYFGRLEELTSWHTGHRAIRSRFGPAAQSIRLQKQPPYQRPNPPVCPHLSDADREALWRY
jgi:hypothetical protein